MKRLSDPHAADRLARALVSDILLYNAEALSRAAPEVAEAVEEGRQLYRARVEEPLFELFERAVAESALAPWGLAIGVPRAPEPLAPPPAPPAALDAATYRSVPRARPEDPNAGRSNGALLVAVAAAVLMLGALMYMLARP